MWESFKGYFGGERVRNLWKKCNQGAGGTHPLEDKPAQAKKQSPKKGEGELMTSGNHSIKNKEGAGKKGRMLQVGGLT